MWLIRGEHRCSAGDGCWPLSTGTSCEELSSFSHHFPYGSNVAVLFSSLESWEVPLLVGAAETLDILGDTGEINLFTQVVLRNALLLLVTKLSITYL